MHTPLLFATALLLLSGCLASAGDVDKAPSASAPPELTVHRFEGDRTLPDGALPYVLGAGFGYWPFDEFALLLSNATVVSFQMTVDWEAATPLTEDLRVQVYYHFQNETAGPTFGDEVVYVHGRSPLTWDSATIGNVRLPLHDAADLTLVVGPMQEELPSSSGYYASVGQEYHYVIEVVTRALVPGETHWFEGCFWCEGAEG